MWKSSGLLGCREVRRWDRFLGIGGVKLWLAVLTNLRLIAQLPVGFGQTRLAEDEWGQAIHSEVSSHERGLTW